MSGRLITLLLAGTTGPGVIWLASLVLWENEDRFDYHKAARNAAVVESIADATPSEAIAFTAASDMTAFMPGEFVEGFTGYLRVRRDAEIYAWIEEEYEDEDGNVTVNVYDAWSSSVESNSWNAGVIQAFSDSVFNPARIELGPLEVSQDDLRYVDPFEVIDPTDLTLSEVGRVWELVPDEEHFYLRRVPGEDNIGDERLRYRGIEAAATGTYFGRVENGVAVGMQFEVRDGFVAWLIRDDGVLHHLVNGERDVALATVRRHLARTKWLVRVLGTLAMTIGFWIVFARFLSALYSIRILRGVVEIGVFVLGLAVGPLFALLVVAASAFVHTPWLAAIPFTLAIVGVGYLIRRGDVVGRAAKQWRAKEMHRRRLKRDLQQGVRESAERAKLALMSEEERDARLDELEIEETFVRLALMGRVEHGLGHYEERFLLGWGEKNGLDRQRMSDLMKEAEEESYLRFRLGEDQAPDVDHRDDLRLLVFMALSDGVVSALELEALKRVGERLGVTGDELKEMIASVEAAPEPVWDNARSARL